MVVGVTMVNELKFIDGNLVNRFAEELIRDAICSNEVEYAAICNTTNEVVWKVVKLMVRGKYVRC